MINLKAIIARRHQARYSIADSAARASHDDIYVLTKEVERLRAALRAIIEIVEE